MEITLVQYLIVCPLVFLAGLMDSIAGERPDFPSGLMIAGIPAHLSLGSNKMCSVMGTVVSTARFAKNGFINFKTSVWVCGGSADRIVHWIPPDSDGQRGYHRKLMLVILPVVAVYVLWNKIWGTIPRQELVSAGRKFAVSLAAAFIVGTYDGFYGPGTGTFLILILTGAARYTMKEAAGTTKVINLASNAAAFATFLLNGKVLIPLGFISGLFCILGHYIGSGLVLTNGKKIVRPVVPIVLAILFVKVLMG